MQLRVQGESFTSYQLQGGDSTPSASFTAIGPPRPSDGLGLVDFTDPGPVPLRRFYQAVKVP
ncbi:MAG: hypothetical protein ACR2OZ_05835 [Verrucomicrobiales bacterium]